MKSSPGPAEKQAGDISAQQWQRQKGEADLQDTELGQFTGPADQTPFYHSLVTTGREGTSKAYDAAKSNVATRAREAGFGYEQPVAQGANAGMEAQEASDLAAVPREALQTSAGTGLQAAGLRQGLISDFNPNAMTSTAVSAEQQRRQRQSAMWQNLAKLGTMGASGVVGA